MATSELVFIPSPGAGHLPPTVELGKLLLQRDERLSITIIIMKLSFGPNHNTETPKSTRYIDIPCDESTMALISPHTFLSALVEHHKPHVRNILTTITESESVRLAGIVVDMFCVPMTEVANEFGAPTYTYYTSGAATLGLMFHLQAKRDNEAYDVTELKDSETELFIPSGHRFLWSLRRPPPTGKIEFPKEYENPEDVLPEGFLERTASVGKVIGWAPQMAVLSHPSVGGFLSHCGWNSTLESIWCGVPIAAWPLYAEQQLNAFQLVVEQGMAVEIKIDYRTKIRSGGEEVIVTAEEIESGIRKLMSDELMRIKVKDMKEKSRSAVLEGGSSYTSIGRLIDHFMTVAI